MQGDAYQALRQASPREVLEHFLEVEGTRPKFASRRDEFRRWRALHDRAFLERLRRFAEERDDVNPTLTWTVGTRGNQHYRRVQRWLVAKVTLDAIYSCGINTSMRADLDAAEGNLVRFAAVAGKYPEFRLDTVPEDKLATLIAVVNHQHGRRGTIEVLDGCHRVVAMISRGVRETTAFLAELKLRE